MTSQTTFMNFQESQWVDLVYMTCIWSSSGAAPWFHSGPTRPVLCQAQSTCLRARRAEVARHSTVAEELVRQPMSSKQPAHTVPIQATWKTLRIHWSPLASFNLGSFRMLSTSRVLRLMFRVDLAICKLLSTLADASNPQNAIFLERWRL